LFSLSVRGADQPDFPNIYIDEGCAGTHVGSQANPYDDLSDINWTTGGDNSVFDAVAAGKDVVIHLNKGDEWREMMTVGASGSAAHPITITSYGTGADPIINGSDLITPGTSWSEYGGTEQWSKTPDTDWSGDACLIILIPANDLSNNGTKVRVELEANSANTTTVVDVYIGERASSGDAYDFQTGTSTQLTFSGGTGTTISAGNSKYTSGKI